MVGGDLAKEKRPQPIALSQHLKRLREAKLVRTRRDSQSIYYRSMIQRFWRSLQWLGLRSAHPNSVNANIAAGVPCVRSIGCLIVASSWKKYELSEPSRYAFIRSSGHMQSSIELVQAVRSTKPTAWQGYISNSS